MHQKTLTTYLKLCTEYYDIVKTISDEERAFYLDYATKANGPVLEPMCGTGRLLIPMLAAGIDIEGFDASEHMLDALKKKSPNAPVWQQFVQNFTSEKKYQLIFVPFGSWGLITDKQAAKKSLKNMYQHLAAGGTLLLEIDTVHSLPDNLNGWQTTLYTRTDRSKLVLKAFQSYESKKQLFKCLCKYQSITHNIIQVEEHETFEQYLYRFDELDDVLSTIGFGIKKYQDYKKTVAQLSAPMIIYECIKK